MKIEIKFFFSGFEFDDLKSEPPRLYDLKSESPDPEMFCVAEANSDRTRYRQLGQLWPFQGYFLSIP